MRRALPLALALLAGCSPWTEADPPPADFDEYAARRAALVAELDRLIGDAEAESASACRVVLFGDKPCGGHRDARVYSASSANPVAVGALADRITALDRDANERFGLGSDCAVAPEPRAVFEGNRCVPRYGG